MILVDDQMQVCNLFMDKFCLEPLAVWGVNGQDNSHKQTTKNNWPRSNDLFKSGWIATKQATYLRAVELQPTDRTIDQTIS